MNTEHHQRLIAARSDLAVPGQSDFCYDLVGDAACAWRNFGGLSIDEACQKFIGCPQVYQEDFMWMFPAAFEYYYPVVDRYLRCVNVAAEGFSTSDDGCNAHILGCALESQFHWMDGRRPPNYVIEEMRELSHYVRHHLPHYSSNSEEQERIHDCWMKLEEVINGCAFNESSQTGK